MSRTKAERDALVKANMGLVYTIARGDDDLVGAGMLALVEAATTWDGTGEFYRYMRDAVRRAIQIARGDFRQHWIVLDDTVDVATLTNDDVNGWIESAGLDEREREIVEAFMGDTPTTELAKVLQISERRVEQIRAEALDKIKRASKRNLPRPFKVQHACA